jgi:hypothetical protein
VKPEARERALFALLLVVHLLPVWGLSHFLTQDGPAHLDSANALRLYWDAGHPIYRTVFELNGSLEPNLLGHALAALLLGVLPVAVVEKLLVTLCVAGLALAVRYAGGTLASLLAFPFVFNWLLAMGFYNFALSLPMLFFSLGFWWRHRLRLGLRQGVCLSLMWLLLYVSHVVSLVMALVVLGVQMAWLGALERRQLQGLRPLAVGTLKTLLALSPALLLLGEFLTRKGAAVPPSLSLSGPWGLLVRLETLVVFDGAEQAVASFVFGGLVAVAAAALVGRFQTGTSAAGTDAWLLAAAAATAVYFAAPRGMATGAALKERLILFPPLLLLPWLGSHPFSARARGLLQAGAACAALAFIGLRLPAQRALDAQLQEYLSVRASIPRGALLLPLCYEARGIGGGAKPPFSKVAPFIHAAGYLAAERDALQLANYEGNQGHFPLLFRPEWNPYTQLGVYGGIEADPPCAEFEAFNRVASQPIEYVLTWGLEVYEQRTAPEWVGRPYKFREPRSCLTSVRAQLEDAYELVDVSEPNGWARLYRRR